MIFLYPSLVTKGSQRATKFHTRRLSAARSPFGIIFLLSRDHRFMCSQFRSPYPTWHKFVTINLLQPKIKRCHLTLIRVLTLTARDGRHKLARWLHHFRSPLLSSRHATLPFASLHLVEKSHLLIAIPCIITVRP